MLRCRLLRQRVSHQEALELGRRRSQRVPFESSVRIYGTDSDGRAFTRLASTVNLSATGVRVSGIHVRLSVGDVLGVQSRAEKARYEVVWIGSLASVRAGELGLRCLEPQKWIWKVNPPGVAEDNYEPPPKRNDRRRSPRFSCDFGVEVRTSPDVAGAYARCTDISSGGCYVETWSPQPVGAVLTLIARVRNGELRAVATVRAMHPAFGMGLQFLRVEDPELLKKLLDEVSRVTAPRVASDSTLQSQTEALLSDNNAVPGQLLHAEPGSGMLNAKEEEQPCRVLVAEDSRFLRNAYGHFLAKSGFKVMLAADGEAMLRMAVSELPDVIVLDLLMPRMGGVDALKLLKHDPATSEIPVVVISGLSQSNEQKLISAGAHCYFEKMHAGPESLPNIIRRALGSMQPRGAASSSRHEVM